MFMFITQIVYTMMVNLVNITIVYYNTLVNRLIVYTYTLS